MLLYGVVCTLCTQKLARLTMGFDMSKSTAKFITGDESFGDYVPTFEMNSENMWALMPKGEFR